MEKEKEGEPEKVVELYPAPEGPRQLTSTQLEAIRLLNEATSTLSRLGTLILERWQEP